MNLVFPHRGSFRVLPLFICLSLSAQDSSGLEARQLYYKSKSALEDQGAKTPAESTPPAKPANPPTPPASHKKPAPAPLGLKYSLEQEDPSGNGVQVDPDKVFRTGDALRLRLEVNSDSYVYLLSRGASGDGTYLFPQSGEDNKLKAFHSVQVPAKTGDPLRFDEPAGTETLYIVVSRSPVTGLDHELTPAMVAQQLQSRDLVRGKVRPADTAPKINPEHAVYAVNTSSAPGALVVQKLELKHR